MATKKKSSSGSDPKSKKKVKSKMQKVMHEYKHGELKSGGRKKVKNPKQAIAIGLSEARRSGANIPANPKKTKSASKKSTGSKKSSSSKKSATKKSATKKSSSKKSSSKRSPSKK